MSRNQANDPMGPLDETSPADEDSWDSGGEDEGVPAADHNMSRSRQDYDMSAMNNTDEFNQVLEYFMSSEEEFDDGDPRMDGHSDRHTEVDYRIRPMEMIYEVDADFDERYSEMINYQTGRSRRRVDYSIRPTSEFFAADLRLYEVDSGVDVDGNALPERRVDYIILPMSEILGASNQVKDEDLPSTDILSIEWITPSFPSLYFDIGGGSFPKFLVKTTGAEGNAVYGIRYADDMLRYESKHPLMVPFLKNSEVDGPQVSEEFSLEAIGHPVSKACTNPPAPTPVFGPAPPYATAPSGTSQSPPVYPFPQSIKSSSLQSCQYTMSSFCSNARHNSREAIKTDLQIRDVERQRKVLFTNPYESTSDTIFYSQRLTKSLPSDFTPHPLPKMRAQMQPAVPTYGPLAKFLLFHKLPKELRLKIRKRAAHLGHTIGLQDNKYINSPLSFKQVTLPWPLLNTCFESRQEALQLCANFHGSTRYPFIGTNIHADSFWLTNFHPTDPDALQDRPSVSTWDKFVRVLGANRAHVRSLALSWSLWHGFVVGRRFEQKDLLAWELEELVLVRGEQERVEICGRGHRVVMQSPWSEKWRGEEVLVGRELERIRDMAQTEYEVAVNANWDEQRIESAGLRDLSGWVAPKVKMMEAVVLDDQ